MRVSFYTPRRDRLALPSRGLGAFNLVASAMCAMLPLADSKPQIGDLPQWLSTLRISSFLLLTCFGWPMVLYKAPSRGLAWATLALTLILYIRSSAAHNADRFSPFNVAYAMVVVIVSVVACISKPMMISLRIQHGSKTQYQTATPREEHDDFWSLSFAAELLPTIIFSTYSIFILARQVSDLLEIDTRLAGGLWSSGTSSGPPPSTLWFCTWVSYLLKRTYSNQHLQSVMCYYSMGFWLLGADYGLTSTGSQLLMLWTYICHVTIYTLQGATGPLFRKLGRGSQAFSALMALSATANIAVGLLFATRPQIFDVEVSSPLTFRPLSSDWCKNRGSHLCGTLWHIYVVVGIHLMFPASVLVYLHDSTKLVASLRYAEPAPPAVGLV